MLIVPKAVDSSYAKKPKETIKVLLKIVKDGDPWHSIHANACICALVNGPVRGWLATHVDVNTWDDQIGEGNETHREFAYKNCFRLIADK